MRIAVGTDEVTPLTEALKEGLVDRGHEVVVVGEGTPWPDVGRGVGEVVARGEADRGVVCCWTGTGVAIAANKVPGVHDGEPVTWLLPAYRFVGTWEVGEPWYADLPAIDEAYVDLPDPEAPATTAPDIGRTDDPADPASTTTMSSDATAPATSAVDPSTTTSGPAAPVPPSTESQQPATGPTTTTTTVG